MPTELLASYAQPSIPPLYLLRLDDWTEPFPRHWHEEWGVAIIERGVNRFWFRGGWHEAPAGSIIVVPPGEIHDGGLATQPWSEKMAYIPVETMAAIVAACTDRRDPVTFGSPIIDDRDLADALRGLHHTLSSSPPDDPVESAELPIAVLGTLLERYGRVHTTLSARGEAAAVERAKKFMRDAATTRISLADVARAAGMSQFHFIREFGKRVGLTPHAYLKQLRVTFAQRLLSTNESLADIALASGFADQAHLTREFRKTFGLPPGAFRRAQRRGRSR